MAYTVRVEEDTRGIAAGLAPGSLNVVVEIGYGQARALLGALRQLCNAATLGRPDSLEKMSRLNRAQLSQLEEALTGASIDPA